MTALFKDERVGQVLQPAGFAAGERKGIWGSLKKCGWMGKKHL